MSVAGKGLKPRLFRNASWTQSKAMKEVAWPRSEKIIPVIVRIAVAAPNHFSDSDAALPPRRTLITSPRIDSAISAGVSVPISSPMGA